MVRISWTIVTTWPPYMVRKLQYWHISTPAAWHITHIIFPVVVLLAFELSAGIRNEMLKQ